MARERLRATGELTAYHVAWMARLMPFVNVELNPDQINPYRETEADGRAPTSKSPEMARLEEWQQRFRWRVLAGAPVGPTRRRRLNDASEKQQ